MKSSNNKRGFTLIELLAVIAILAILLIIAIPSVIKMYNNAKVNTFVDEVQSVINTAEKQYMSDQIGSVVPTCYSNDATVKTQEGCTELDLSGNKNLKYYVKFEDGHIVNAQVDDGSHAWDSGTLTRVDASSVKAGDVDSENANGAIELEDAQLTLYNIIKNSALTTAIDFKVNSGESGTNGIYTTTETDSGKPVYYYRGSYEALNNNLIFNNFCWKIIRTTETGGVKIIYNGTPTDGKCETQTGEGTQIGESSFNTNSYDNAYVGYMYGTPDSSTYEATHANTNPSAIKTYIDEWYASNMTNVTSKLEDTVFCNDRSTKAYDADAIGDTSMSLYGSLGYGRNMTLYGAIHRASYYSKNPTPSLKCAQQNDKFTVSSTNGNGKLTYPVGLITSDEVVFAGYNTKYSNTSNDQDTTNYLYTNSNYWTLSPVRVCTACGGAFLGYVHIVGFLSNNDAYYSYGVRPAVSLAEGTLVESSGNGSTSNPYVVK